MAGAEREFEGLAAVLAGVELGALHAVVVEPAGVVHLHRATGLGDFAAADHGVFVLQAAGGGDHGMSLLWVKREVAIIPALVRPAAAPARCTIGNTDLHKLFMKHDQRLRAPFVLQAPFHPWHQESLHEPQHHHPHPPHGAGRHRRHGLADGAARHGPTPVGQRADHQSRQR
ncbi:hypothetical protein D9M68_808680 [compost metagenome]